MIWLGRDLKAHLLLSPSLGRDTFHYPRVLQALFSLALDTARDPGAATAALGTRCQGPLSLTGNNSCPISHLSLSSFCWMLRAWRRVVGIPTGQGCAGSRPDTCPSQVGQGPSTPARANAPVPRAPETLRTWRAPGIPCSSWVSPGLSILAAILHLGNVVIRGQHRRGDSCVVEPDSEALGLFCALLGMVMVKLVTAGETFMKSRQQALDSRGALAKHMYRQALSWMVRRSLKGHHTSTGILDINGFLRCLSTRALSSSAAATPTRSSSSSLTCTSWSWIRRSM